MGNSLSHVVLIGDNFISPSLIAAAKNQGVPIYAEDKMIKVLKNEFPETKVHNVKELGKYIKDNPNAAFYLNSDDCPVFIYDYSNDEELKTNVNYFKDKYEFRKLCKSMYPNYYFEKVSFRDILSFKIPDHSVVVKPVKGFFGTGIRRVDTQDEWEETVKEILAEVEENSKYFSDKILDSSSFIVEEYIEGEEYAIDIYYDKDGEPVPLIVYHHPYRDKNDLRHVLYYTDEALMKRLTPRGLKFFKEISKKIDIKNFPMHAEFRETKDDELIPMEINPLRYGGFSLADLMVHGYGFNPYEHFLTQSKPNWEKIFSERKGAYFGWILGYNADLDFDKFEPDHEKFKKTFENIIHYNKLDHTKYPVFATVYAESKNLEDLRKYLTVDFKKFFRKL